jgi:ABC-type cobalamin/Fe3+-siderophores transport system ATPase subunit
VEILKNAGLTPSLDKIMGEIFLAHPQRISSQKAFIKTALEVTGLLNKTNKRFSELTPLEFFQFSIARALLQSPTILMFSVPPDLLGKLDYDKFNGYVNNIKEKFHTVLLMHGPEPIITNCDKILTLSKNLSKIGTMDEYISDLPSSGDVLTIELDNPSGDLITALQNLSDQMIIIEERKNEKYKIFIQDQLNENIVKITELFGPNLFSFKKSKATLGECLQFINYKV